MMIEPESADQIDEAAFAWVARLDRCGADAAIQAELQAWLSLDERRRGAFLRAEAIWGKLDRASQAERASRQSGSGLAMRKRASEESSEFFPVNENREKLGRASRQSGSGLAMRKRASEETSELFPVQENRERLGRGSEHAIRIDRRLALTGGVAALAAAAAGVWVIEREPLYATTIGQVRRVPLADGSGMVLNTGSRARVALGDHERRVQLAQGEAWFQVAKDRTRPFVVEAGPVRVRAVGTAFSVRRLSSGADVLVSEGIVEAWLVGEKQPRTRLIAGQKARVLEGRPVLVQASAVEAIERKLAWRSNRIELDGETLGEAVADFNRYNRRQVVLADSRLEGRRLYGVFRADDPESFARSVALSLGVDVGFEPDRITLGEPQSI